MSFKIQIGFQYQFEVQEIFSDDSIQYFKLTAGSSSLTIERNRLFLSNQELRTPTYKLIDGKINIKLLNSITNAIDEHIPDCVENKRDQVQDSKMIKHLLNEVFPIHSNHKVNSVSS